MSEDRDGRVLVEEYRTLHDAQMDRYSYESEGFLTRIEKTGSHAILYVYYDTTVGNLRRDVDELQHLMLQLQKGLSL